jgi:hypothetical protein
LAAALGGGIPAADLPQSLRLESDAYGDLIIETAGIATLAARPRLAGRGVPPAG